MAARLSEWILNANLRSPRDLVQHCAVCMLKTHSPTRPAYNLRHPIEWRHVSFLVFRYISTKLKSSNYKTDNTFFISLAKKCSLMWNNCLILCFFFHFIWVFVSLYALFSSSWLCIGRETKLKRRCCWSLSAQYELLLPMIEQLLAKCCLAWTASTLPSQKKKKTKHMDNEHRPNVIHNAIATNFIPFIYQHKLYTFIINSY